MSFPTDSRHPEGRGLAHRFGGGTSVLAACVLWWGAGLVLSGCPSYEDARSGTYREIDASTRLGDEKVQIDFFRYGDNARAIFRLFEADVPEGEPFGEQVFCMRTKANAFQPSQTPQFELPILADQNLRFIEGGRLFGSFLDDETLEASIYHGGTPVVEKRRLEHVPRPPDPTCSPITPEYIHPLFDLPGGAPNTLPASTDYRIEHPVLTVQWVGIRVVSGGPRGGAQFVRTNETSRRWVRLGSGNFDADRGLFRGDQYMWVDPPDEDIRRQGERTSYAIGHVVVIDDQTDEDRFSWDREAEPIVATALQRGTTPDAPDAADGSAKALLFVEGDLADLSEQLRERRFTGLDQLEPDDRRADDHFYVVEIDVSFRQNEIVRIRLEEALRRPGARDLTLKATDRFLNSEADLLPRLPPLEGAGR